MGGVALGERKGTRVHLGIILHGGGLKLTVRKRKGAHSKKSAGTNSLVIREKNYGKQSEVKWHRWEGGSRWQEIGKTSTNRTGNAKTGRSKRTGASTPKKKKKKKTTNTGHGKETPHARPETRRTFQARLPGQEIEAEGLPKESRAWRKSVSDVVIRWLRRQAKKAFFRALAISCPPQGCRKTGSMGLDIHDKTKPGGEISGFFNTAAAMNEDSSHREG